MPELKKLKMYSWKLKTAYWKLKTVYWKLKIYSWKLKTKEPFPYGKIKDKEFFNKDQISSGEDKRKGKEGVWGRIPKWGLFLQNFHY